MNPSRMALAESMSGDDGEEGGKVIMEGKGHEDRQEGKMDEILSHVVKIHELLEMLMGEEQREKNRPPATAEGLGGEEEESGARPY